MIMCTGFKDRDTWRTIVKTAVSWTAERLSFFQDGLTELVNE
jgi:hypothetical protein